MPKQGARAGEKYNCSSGFKHDVTNFDKAHRSSYKNFLETAKRYFENLNLTEAERNILTGNRCVNPEPKIHSGDIASGPVVAKSSKFIEWVKEPNCRFKALEMEGGGMLASVYEDHEQIAKTLMLRGISDFGDKGKKENDKIRSGAMRKYAMHNAARLFF